MLWKKILPIFGIALFVYIVLNTGLEKIFKAAIEIRASHLIFVFLLVIPLLLIQTLKWHLLIRKQGFRLSFRNTLKYFLIGRFYGDITPGRFGSFIKIYYLKERLGKSTVESSVSVVLDKLFDSIVMCIVALVGAGLLIKYYTGLFTFIIFMLVGLIFLMFLVINKTAGRFILKQVYKFLIPARIKEQTRKSFHLFYKSMPRKRDLIVPFILTFVTWLIIYSQSYIIAISLGFNVPFLNFISLFAIASFVGIIPITIAGLGTREATLIFLYNIYNVTAEQVISMSLIGLTILTYLPNLLIAIFCLKEKVPKREK